ncbi:unnamed protein product [Adineta ricciae]|uniref:Uncharacterized protein n=1 Tax=Adineta ricciae TaxID=249248 RepID=A0A815R536_ADIRI|nr:unnamed protein product [Adineta ricciae]CAF1471829.1 unnamed protein product [Adineta ricciae]
MNIKHFNDLQNAFQRSKEALDRFIEFDLPKTHLNQRMGLGCSKLVRYAMEGESNAKNFFLSGADLNDETSFHDYYKHFIQNAKKPFRESFNSFTKSFIERPVDIHDQMMKQYGYPSLHSTAQTIDDRVHENLAFELEASVSKIVKELILIAPTVVYRLCEDNDESKELDAST